MAAEIVRVAHLRRDGGTQMRAELNEDALTEYVALWQAGETAPPVTAFYDGAAYWLADGFHRAESAARAGVIEIPCDVRAGTRRDAILYAVGANARHGLRRTNADKRRAVETLLNDEEWRGWSDIVVAGKCGVSDRYVAKVRAEVTPNGSECQPRKTSDGRVMNTANIGRRAVPDLAPVFAVAGPVSPEVKEAFAEAQHMLRGTRERVVGEEAQRAPLVASVAERVEAHIAPARAALAVSNVTTPIRSAPVDTTVFDADARELRKLLTEARNLASRLAERGAGLGGVVRAGRLADVRRLVAEALQSLGEVKVAV